MKNLTVFVFLFIVFLLFESCKQEAQIQNKTTTNDYEDLITFFKEWREFQKPYYNNGIPDYTPTAMEQQRKGIPEFREKLSLIDTSGWPVSHKVDYRLIEAEINGLEFDHDVLRPWSRNPLFYTVIQMYEPDVPAREGPELYGVLNLFEYDLPLGENDQEVFREKLGAIPEILDQARKNLVEEAGDLYFLAIGQKRNEARYLSVLAERLESNPGLSELALLAKSSVEDFITWLEKRHKGMKSYSGIGKENYTRYMREVHLVPYTWEEQVDLVSRELERSLTALAMEEHKNRNLPPLKPAGSLEEMQERKKKTVEEFMTFLREEEIFTVPDYMHLDDEVNNYLTEEQRDFFTHVDYHHCMPLECHMIHWLEKQREKRNTHPIRGEALLYNIWDSRAEGLATGFEELMMQAGIVKDDPRARELFHIMLAFRAIRALGELYLHSGEWTLQEAIDFAVEKTPRGWITPQSNTIHGDYAIYLAQPGYGTSYVIGKLQLEKLIADRKDQLGNQFILKEFFDDYFNMV
ncbi:MAG: DUF885 family protein [Bacteroidota bacterium]|nr:DUF885 family protein [Bacteroidota bacterium]